MHETHEHHVRAQPRAFLAQREEHLVVPVGVDPEVHRLDARMQDCELSDPRLVVAHVFAECERVAEGRDSHSAG